MSQEEKNIPVEQQRLEKEQIEDMGSVYRTRGAHALSLIHILQIVVIAAENVQILRLFFARF